jgi:hypothetical protein
MARKEICIHVWTRILANPEEASSLLIAGRMISARYAGEYPAAAR